MTTQKLTEVLITTDCFDKTKTIYTTARFQVLMAVSMKVTAPWDTGPRLVEVD
jgi:hypothetical protein